MKQSPSKNRVNMAKQSTGPASPPETAVMAVEDSVIPTTARLRRRNAVSPPRRAGAAGLEGVVGSSPIRRTPAAMVLAPRRKPGSLEPTPALTPSNMTARPMAVTLLLQLSPIVCDVPCQFGQHEAKELRVQIDMRGEATAGWDSKERMELKGRYQSEERDGELGGFRSSVIRQQLRAR
jgi:hypothetical protein